MDGLDADVEGETSQLIPVWPGMKDESAGIFPSAFVWPAQTNRETTKRTKSHHRNNQPTTARFLLSKSL